MNLIREIKRYLAIRFPTQKDATQRIISFWEKGGPDFEYYQSADQEHWMQVFWAEDSVFYPLFQKLNPERLLEIACGTGRHSVKVIDQIRELYLLDSSREALNLAAQRFAGRGNVTYIHSPDGYGIPAMVVKDASLTAVFSYDALVHFEKEAVESYVADSFRVLEPGGYALFHHSNYDKNPGGRFSDNPGWRNFMTRELFTAMAQKHGFAVVHSQVFSFSRPDSDCITLLQKPEV